MPVVFAAPEVSADGAHALDVTWNAVADPRNRVKGYIVEIRTADSAAWQEMGGVTDHVPGKPK